MIPFAFKPATINIVSDDEYAMYAELNRAEWKKDKGQDETWSMIRKVAQPTMPMNGTVPTWVHPIFC